MPRTHAAHDPRVRFGLAVRAAREAGGLTQERLAEKSGLHRNYVGSVERGERNVALLNIWKLAEALQVAPSELIASAERL